MPSTAKPLALVTGASSGLGEHFARTLAARGANVIAVARRADRLEALVRELRAAGGTANALTMDVADRASVDGALAAMVQIAGAPDIVVNNAGIARSSASIDLTEAEWREVMSTNLDGAWRVAQAS